MPCSHKDAVAAMPIIILLLHVHICRRGHHLSLGMYGVKVTEEAHVWVPAVCQMVRQVYIVHSACPVVTKRPLLQCP
jgi:hypothetical protein